MTVLGEPGIGKSRLAREFAVSAGELPLVGRCVSYGDGATFLPLAQIVRKALPERPRAAILALLEGDEQASLVAERVSHLTEPADGAASTGEVFWAVRRFLEALARERPLLVVLEDIHWAGPRSSTSSSTSIHGRRSQRYSCFVSHAESCSRSGRMGRQERDPRPGAASREAGRHPCGGSRSWGRRRGGAG